MPTSNVSDRPQAEQTAPLEITSESQRVPGGASMAHRGASSPPSTTRLDRSLSMLYFARDRFRRESTQAPLLLEHIFFREQHRYREPNGSRGQRSVHFSAAIETHSQRSALPDQPLVDREQEAWRQSQLPFRISNAPVKHQTMEGEINNRRLARMGHACAGMDPNETGARVVRQFIEESPELATATVKAMGHCEGNPTLALSSAGAGRPLRRFERGGTLLHYYAQLAMR